MENMEIYNKVRVVPEEAKKPINGGRLKGYTDINPQWRIQMLTELFGACGFGWYYTVTDRWLEGKDNELCAFVDIDLYVKVNDEWSKPIHGNGGSKLCTVEKSGVYVSDEAYKMATTDAISVACKELGFGANVYWANGRSKYNMTLNNVADTSKNEPKENKPATPKADKKEAVKDAQALTDTRAKIYKYIETNGLNENAIAQHFGGVDTVYEWSAEVCDRYKQYVKGKGKEIA